MDQPPPPPPQPQQPTQAQPLVNQPYGGQAPQPLQRTNGMSVAALISGILGLTIFFGIGSVAALIFGYVARGQIKRSQGQESGNGMAIAGIVMGWIGVVVSVVLIGLLFVGSIALFNWSQSEDFQEAVDDGVGIIADASLDEISEADARCTPVESYPNQGQDHIDDGQSTQYNSNPPTSGPHYAVPAEPGFYEPDSGIEPERLVHNLEHGQIVIWYRPGEDDLGFLEQQVEELVSQDPQALIGAPYPEMNEGYNIVITSWTKARACVNASQEVVDDFRRQFQGKAPERLTPPFRG